MMIFNSNSSPFMVLWYLFLLFLTVVIIINILALIIRGFIAWRIKRLLTRSRKAAK